MRKTVAAVVVTLVCLLTCSIAVLSQSSAPANSAGWSQAWGGPGHSSHIAMLMGDRQFREVWRKAAKDNPGRPAALSAGEGVVCAVYELEDPTSKEVRAFETRTGRALWHKPLKSSRALTPAISGGRALVASSDPAGNSALRCLDLKSGDEKWMVEVPGDITTPPLADDKNAYVLSQLADGAWRLAATTQDAGKPLYALDRFWDVALAPAVNSSLIAVCAGRTLQFFGKSDGKKVFDFKLEDAAKQPAGAPRSDTLVMDEARCLVTTPDLLQAVDIGSRKGAWSQRGNFNTSPAQGSTHLYLGDNNCLHAFEASSGRDGGVNYALEMSAPSSVMLLDDAMLVRTSTGVIIYRHADGAAVQRLSARAPLTIADDSLFAVDGVSGELVRFGLRTPAATRPLAPVSPSPENVALSGDWPTFGGSNTRSGLARGALAGKEAVLTWEREVGHHGVSECVGGGQVFVRTDHERRLLALDAVTGQERWQVSTTGAWDSVSYANQTIFAVRSGPSGADRQNCYLVAIDAVTGKVLWSSRMGGRVPGKNAIGAGPLITGSLAWIGDEGEGCIAAYDLAKGEKRVSAWMPVKDRCHLSASNGVLYFWRPWELHAVDSKTGDRLWSLGLKDPDSQANEFDKTPVIDGDMLFVGDDKVLVAIDLVQRKEAWRVLQANTTVAAASGGIIAIGNGGSLMLYNRADGKPAGTAKFAEGGPTYLVRQPIITDDSIIVCDSAATYIVDRKSLEERQRLPHGGYAHVAAGALFINSLPGASCHLSRYDFRTVRKSEPPQALNVELDTEEDEWADFRLLGNAADDAGLIAYVNCPAGADDFWTCGGDGCPATRLGNTEGEPAGYCRPKAEKSVRMFVHTAANPADEKKLRTVRVKYVLSDGRKFSAPAIVTIRIHPKGSMATALELWTVENVPVRGMLAGASPTTLPNGVLGTTMPRADGGFIYTPAPDMLADDFLLVSSSSAAPALERVRVNVVQGCDRRPAITSQAPGTAKAGDRWTYTFTLQCDEAVKLDAVKAVVGGVAPPQIQLDGELKREGRKITGRLVWEKAWEGYDQLSSVRFALMAIDTAGRSGDVQWIELKRE